MTQYKTMNLKVESGFNRTEASFLHSCSGPWSIAVGHIATVSPDGQTDVVAVGYDFDGKYIYIGGHRMEQTRKYKNIMAGNTKVSFVVDDHTRVFPRNPRWFRIYATAEIIDRTPPGGLGSGKWIKLTPRISWSFNLMGEGCPPDDHDAFFLPDESNPRYKRTVHSYPESET